jgi:hypothetical protein
VDVNRRIAEYNIVREQRRMLVAIMHAKAAIYILAAHNIRQLSVTLITLSTSGGCVNTEQFTSRCDELRNNEQ